MEIEIKIEIEIEIEIETETETETKMVIEMVIDQRKRGNGGVYICHDGSQK